MKDVYNLKIKKHDSIEDAKDKNDKLITIVNKLDKKVKELSSKNTQLQRVFNKTEVFLKEITDSVSLMEILEHVREGRPLRRLSRSCPDCGDDKLKKLNFNGFYIVLCSKCTYRERVDVDGELKTEAK